MTEEKINLEKRNLIKHGLTVICGIALASKFGNSLIFGSNPTINFSDFDARYLKLDGSNDPITGNITINTNSTTALLVEQDGVKDNVLIVDTTNGRVGIGVTPTGLLHLSATASTNVIVVAGTYDTNILFNWQPTVSGNTALQYGYYNVFGVNPTGNITSFNGMDLLVQAKTSSSNITTVRGINFTLQSAVSYSGAITNSRGIVVNAPAWSGSVPSSDTRGLYIANHGNASTTSTYAIYIDSQTASGTNTYSIYGGSGLYRFGDQLFIDGSADRIQLRVQAHSSQTANIVTVENSSGTVLTSINPNGFLTISNSGITSGSVYAVNTSVVSSSTSGEAVGGLFGSSSTGTGGNSIGFYARATKASNTGSVYGFDSIATVDSDSATITSATVRGANIRTQINLRTNNISNLAHSGLVVNGATIVHPDATTLTNATINGILIGNQGNALFTTSTALYINAQSGSTTNYAIVTNEGNIVFNEGGDASTDFRVESDTEANMIFLDANGNTDGQLFLGGSTNGTVVEKGGDTYFIGSGSGLPFGSMYGNEIAWTQTNAVQNTWYEISDADIAQDNLNLVTYGSSRLTVSKAGKYMVVWSVTSSVSIAGKHVQVGIGVSGTVQNCGINHYDLNLASSEIPMSGNCIVTCTASQYISVFIRTTDTGTPNLEVDHINLTVVQVGA